MKLRDLGFTNKNSRTIKTNQENIEALHIAELADSISKIGLINPIVLIEDDGLKILAGQRRYLAIKELRGEDGSLCEGEYVIRGQEAAVEVSDHLEVSIVENQFRESLSPFDLNRAALKLNQLGSHSDKEIARILNITPARLKRIQNLSMDMNKMTPEIVAELKKSGDEAVFTDAHWEKMRDIEDTQTQKDVFDHIMEKQLPPRDLPSLITSVEKANKAAYGDENYDDEGTKSGQSPAAEEDNDGHILKYKHKGDLVMEFSDGKPVFKVSGRGEEGDIPLEQYMEYLKNGDKFKCKIDLKLTFIPIDQ